MNENMAFLDFLFKNRRTAKHPPKEAVSCDQCQEIMLQYDKKRFVYKIQQGMIEYRNLISFAEGGMKFPEGFFDTKTAFPPESARKEICRLFDAAVFRMSLEEDLSEEIVVKCTKHTGAQIDYSSCDWRQIGFSNMELYDLYNLLDSFCEFVPAFEYTAAEPAFDHDPPTDPRYFEETLWTCQNCLAGNLLEHRCCIKCGTPRSW